MNNLEIKNISKRYDAFMLQDVSFSVPQGTIVGLIGENGAGKSTTINIILNEIKSDEGNVFIFGKNYEIGETENKERIGFVFDEFNLPDMLNAIEIQSIMCQVYKYWDDQQFWKLIDNFGLPKSKPFKEFSKGMKVKLEFAIALSHAADLLILDEATSGLDPVIRNEILENLKEYVANKKRSVLFSSHILSDLEKIADDIVFIHKGKIVFQEKKEELKKKYFIINTEKGKECNINCNKIIAKIQKERLSILIKNDSVPICGDEYEVLTPDIEDIMLFYIGGEVQ